MLGGRQETLYSTKMRDTISAVETSYFFDILMDLVYRHQIARSDIGSRLRRGFIGKPHTNVGNSSLKGG